MISDLAKSLRKEYLKSALDSSNVEPDPIDQFKHWFEDAMRAEIEEPNAFVLATATKAGIPSARAVLLKDFSAQGFTFFTNFLSRKGMELAENPHAAMLFLWTDLERQIRIEGSVEKISTESSDAYFRSRPRSAQLGAHASAQSQTLSNRTELEEKLSKVEKSFQGKDVPRPECWGGYCIVPKQYEFWQGRESRLHDRLLYSQGKDSKWEISRLSP